MKDRVPRYPGRVKLLPVPGQADTFDLVRADEPVEAGTALNKANLLSDETAGLLGMTQADPTPDDAVKRMYELTIGNRATTAEAIAGTSLDKWITPSTLSGFWNAKKMVTGTYTGNNSPRHMSLGFSPSFVIVQSKEFNFKPGIAIPGFSCSENGILVLCTSSGGFDVGGKLNDAYYAYNPYRYVAFR